MLFWSSGPLCKENNEQILVHVFWQHPLAGFFLNMLKGWRIKEKPDVDRLPKHHHKVTMEVLDLVCQDSWCWKWQRIYNSMVRIAELGCSFLTTNKNGHEEDFWQGPFYKEIRYHTQNSAIGYWMNCKRFLTLMICDNQMTKERCFKELDGMGAIVMTWCWKIWVCFIGMIIQLQRDVKSQIVGWNLTG